MAQAKKALAKNSSKKHSRAPARASVKTYSNYIGGKWVQSESGEVFENINPANTEDVIGRFPLSTRDDVNAAVNAAQSAYDGWRNLPAPKRAEILFRLGEILICNKDRFTADMTREMGKVVKEAGGDVQEAIDCTYYTAGEGRRLHGFTTPAEMPDKFAMCVRQPVGLCGLITPWNFPMAIPSWKLIPALVCGNTVVLKPAEDTPLSTYNLVQACEQAGIPPGVVNLVTGYGENAGAAITNHPALRLISFTGSTEIGRIVASACAERNAICSLEMGGKNVIIVMDDADIDLEIANGVRYGLSAAIYTRDVNRAFRAMQDMYTGIFYVNASTIGAEVHLPFGGTKATGNGHREAGTQVLNVFSEWKSIYVDYSGKLQRAQIDLIEGLG